MRKEIIVFDSQSIHHMNSKALSFSMKSSNSGITPNNDSITIISDN